MSTIPIEVSTEQLFRAVAQLPTDEFQRFISNILLLRAQRNSLHLNPDETALLLQINASLPPNIQARFDTLIAHREAEIITTEELEELIQLTQAIEHQAVQRLEALHELAILRGTTVQGVMQALGIPLQHQV